MISNSPCDQDAARRTLGLESSRYVDAVAMKVRTISDHIAEVDASAKSDRPIGSVGAIVVGYLPLNADCTAHGPVDAIEHDEQRVACRLKDAATVFVDRGVDQRTADSL
jgi:hypothetical protein